MEILDLLNKYLGGRVHVVCEKDVATNVEEWERLGRPRMWVECGRVMLDDGEAVAYFDHSFGWLAIVYQGNLFDGKDSTAFGDYTVTFECGDSEPKWFKRIW